MFLCLVPLVGGAQRFGPREVSAAVAALDSGTLTLRASGELIAVIRRQSRQLARGTRGGAHGGG